MEDDNLKASLHPFIPLRPTDEKGKYELTLRCKRCKIPFEQIVESPCERVDDLYSLLKLIAKGEPPGANLAERRDICDSCRKEIEEQVLFL